MHTFLRSLILVFSFCAVFSASAASPTNTIPVVNIRTQGNAPILDKVTKIPATMTITIPEGYTTLNGREATNPGQVTMTIRGRGNASWKMDKKPYKLKFDSKTEILGMPKSKHFALIPYAVNLISYGCVAGMEIARYTGQSWAPYSEPVEVMLNGEYIGRYFMVESVKIDKNRLNISEQPDNNEDASTIDGGWLVEIDNYYEDEQIVIEEKPGIDLRVTYHTPEAVSDIQKKWLTDQFTTMNAAIYSGDASGEAWAQYIDPASVARYFIVREILGDTDGFSGSFYLHKDFNTKWFFGPMWDLSLDIKYGWIHEVHPSYSQVHWMEPIFYTDIFQAHLVEEWNKFKPHIDHIYDYIDRLGEITKYADIANFERWPQYENGNSIQRATRSKEVIAENFSFLDEEIAIMSVIGIGVRPADAPLISLVGGECRVGFVSSDVLVNVYRIDGTLAGTMVCRGGDTVDMSAYGKGIFVVRASAAGCAPATVKIVNI